MKKKIFSVAIVALLLFACLVSLFPTSIVNAESNMNKWCTANNYCYRLDKLLTESPDSFEVWVKLPQDSIGGTIVGNYYNSSYGFPGATNWEVDATGKIKVMWNYQSGFQCNKTFDNTSILDGVYHHIAVIRDDVSFTLYIDGKMVDSFSAVTTDAVTSMPISIGVDYQNWKSSKTPLDGDIKQLTLYHGQIDEAQIRSDMNNEAISENATSATLLGNWYFGETWTNRTVSDTSSNGNNATLCTFEKYVGVADKEDYDYAIICVPDIQSMNYYRTSRMYAMFDYIAENAESKKYVYVSQVGDLSDRGPEENLYERAQEAISYLDGVVPYSFVQGNHDYVNNALQDRDSTYYEKYFSYDKYSKMDYFGGAYKEGSMCNYYTLFSACGVDYLMLNLEFFPGKSVVRWANRVCEMFPDRRVIVTTHGYIDPDGALLSDAQTYKYGMSKVSDVSTSKELFDGLITKQPNIFMVFCGHCGSDDIVMRTDRGVNGNLIYSFQIDFQFTRYQNEEIGEDIYVEFKFHEDEQFISICAYSPEYDACFNIQNQYRISIAECFSK